MSTSAALPRWLVYAGWTLPGAIFGVVFFPFVLPVLWFLAIAVVGLSGTKVASSLAAAQAM